MVAQTEGIALLSMYGDDEEEEEAASTADEEETAASALAEDSDGEDNDETLKDNFNKNKNLQQSVPEKSPKPFTSPSPLHPLYGAEMKTLSSPFPLQTPTPQLPASLSQLSSPLSLTSPSPPPALGPLPAMMEYLDGQRAIRSALAIVDYAQDEMAMSPEAEVMETEIYGRVIFGAKLHASDGNIEGTTPVTSQSFTPLSQQEPLPPFDIYEQSKFEASITMEFTVTESEVAEVKVPSTVSTDMQIDKNMQNFLPPTVATKCLEDLQEKINKFLAYKRAGKSFNADLRNRKDYRNPNFLQHAVSYQDIDEIGTCFRKEVFAPHGYDKSDYYDEIEADLKRELERREHERKKSQKIDLVSGCTQGGVAPALKTNAHAPAAGISSFLSSSLPPSSTSGDAARDSRTNKKSKWDKVDGDAKIPLPSGGHDNPPSVNVNASHLSAANAGTGYSAFAQLKRREAEERKLNERKFDKRS